MSKPLMFGMGFVFHTVTKRKQLGPQENGLDVWASSLVAARKERWGKGRKAANDAIVCHAA